MAKKSLSKVEGIQKKIAMAQEAVADMADESIKPVAFQTVLQRLLTLDETRSDITETAESKKKSRPRAPSRASKRQDQPSEEVDLTALINATKEAKEFGLIEKNILDRSSQVDRILLPLHVAHAYVSEKLTLTSGEISKFLAEFGVNVAQPNVAKTLSTIAVKYVLGDKRRKKGHAVRYRLSRPGSQYITAVIQGKSNE